MFQVVKGFKKEDLKYITAEMGEDISFSGTVADLKNLILENKEYN